MDEQLGELEEIAEHIRDFGWHCLHVHPTEPGQDAFSYTIGLSESYGAPEILIFGLSTEQAHRLLNECATLAKGGHIFAEGVPDANVLAGGYSVVFRSVVVEQFPEYLGTALRHYRSHHFQAVVMFLPDKAHLFPWQLGYNGISADEPLAIV